MGKEQGIERGKYCLEGQPSLNSEMESRTGNRKKPRCGWASEGGKVTHGHTVAQGCP